MIAWNTKYPQSLQSLSLGHRMRCKNTPRMSYPSITRHNFRPRVEVSNPPVLFLRRWTETGELQANPLTQSDRKNQWRCSWLIPYTGKLKGNAQEEEKSSLFCSSDFHIWADVRKSIRVKGHGSCLPEPVPFFLILQTAGLRNWRLWAMWNHVGVQSK